MINYLYQQLSLTGCDTVGKVGTKLSLLNTMETDEDLLQYFGKDRLDSDAIAADSRCGTISGECIVKEIRSIMYLF